MIQGVDEPKVNANAGGKCSKVSGTRVRPVPDRNDEGRRPCVIRALGDAGDDGVLTIDRIQASGTQYDEMLRRQAPGFPLGIAGTIVAGKSSKIHPPQ